LENELSDPIRVLVVDDVPSIRELVQEILENEGYRVFTAADVEQALEIIDSRELDIVITDNKMPKISGLDLVRHVHNHYKLTEIIMITGYASIEGAVEAMSTGAVHYLPKPFDRKALLEAMEKARHKLKMREATADRQTRLIHGLIGESKPMKRVYQKNSKGRRYTGHSVDHG